MQSYQMPKGSTHLDFSPGPLKNTETPTDLAISGDGFFEIELDTGELGYTRDGEFHINDQGELVTKQDIRSWVTTEAHPLPRRHWAEFHDQPNRAGQ